MRGCIQCGTCTASCPNAFAMDVSPRRMWRLLLLGLLDEVLSSRTFWFCSTCYTCTLRCPRGLPLTETIGALKRLAGQETSVGVDQNAAFYRTFLDNIHRYGRIQETDLMLRYFIAKRDVFLPLQYVPLGMKLMRKGKLHMPSTERRGKLDSLFNSVARLEDKT
nr:4Fe-4S dicluster domain-containing protein [Desulfovibrio inopinatus]